MVRGVNRWKLAALAAAVGLLGCGGSEAPPAATSASMMPRSAAGAEAAAGNRAPRIESVRFQPHHPGAGEPVRAVVEASDPDGDGLRFGFAWRLNGEPVPAGGPQVALPQSGKGDEISVWVTASDGLAESAAFEASTRVGNQPPQLHGVQIDPGHRITAGGAVSVRPLVEDPDGDPISFAYTWWVNGATVAETGPALSTENLRRGDAIRVRVVARDGEEESNAIQSPEIEVVNAAPVIVSEPGATGSDGVFRYTVHAEDADGDRGLRFSLARAPEGMTVAPATGDIQWKPGTDQAGRHPVEVVVEDLQGGRASQSFEVIVGFADEGDTPPPASSGE